MSKQQTKPGWKDIPIGGKILNAGNAREYKTGSWRSIRPIFYKDRCINCMRCWISCPDDAIIVEDEEVKGVDYDYCKGCGLCHYVCPVKPKAYEMVPETEADKVQAEQKE